jgi:hypothetical protein
MRNENPLVRTLGARHLRTSARAGRPDPESGEDSSVIMAKTHHRSIRTTAHYTKPGLAAVTKATERLDPPHRRN